MTFNLSFFVWVLVVSLGLLMPAFAGQRVLVDSDLTRQMIDARRYEHSFVFGKYDLKVVRAFDWHYESAHGTILLAQASGPADDMPCIVFNKSKNKIRYVDESQSQTLCRWSYEMARAQVENGRLTMRIAHEINFGISPDSFVKANFTLVFDRARGIFCAISENPKVACPVSFQSNH